MKCAQHVDQDAVGSCNGCGKGLCVQCVGRFETPFCESCLMSHNDTVARDLYLGLGITMLIFAGALYLALTKVQGTVSNALLLGALAAWTYWGWKFLSRYAPRLTQGGPVAWFFYLSIKATAAYFIGIVVGPYQIYKSIREIIAIRRLKGQVHRGEA